jgi:hypothetical protein
MLMPDVKDDDERNTEKNRDTRRLRQYGE